MEVAADAELRHLNLTGPEDLTRTGNGVVDRLVERVGEVRVGAKLAGERLRIERRFFRAGVAGQPREVREREWLRLLGVGRRGRARRLSGRFRLGARRVLRHGRTANQDTDQETAIETHDDRFLPLYVWAPRAGPLGDGPWIQRRKDGLK